MGSQDRSDVTGLPSELGIDHDLERERTELTVETDTRRYGKTVTIVSGFDAATVDVSELASDLKRELATGGSVKDGRIELQGEHVDAARRLLRERGFGLVHD